MIIMLGGLLLSAKSVVAAEYLDDYAQVWLANREESLEVECTEEQFKEFVVAWKQAIGGGVR